METNIMIGNHTYIDLGLPSGLLWATCNVGASSPEQYGDYFAWGETKTKEEYYMRNCKTYGESMLDISGDSSYDVARAKWGGSWRMPTKVEMEELLNECLWEWTTVNGIKGYKVTGSNGNSIFLPAAGCSYASGLFGVGFYGGYWSSTPGEYDDCGACSLDFNDEYQYVDWHNHGYGQSVRPVKDGNVNKKTDYTNQGKPKPADKVETKQTPHLEKANGMEKLNLIEILKDCPKGMELDCTICNGVKFIELDRYPNFPIVVRANNGYEFTLTKYGQVHNIDDAKCVIFPKGKTSWKEFVIPFKVGDWITNGVYTWKVISVDKFDYTLQNQCGECVEDTIDYVNKVFHLWSIQDAKDGDILYRKSPLTNIEYIVMNRGTNGYGNIDSYFRYNTEFGFGINIPSVFNSEQNITPATKEQSDLLFTKMKEAGYEWDFEKKELKKIEQVELPNGEDYGIDSLYHAEKILEKTLGDVEGYQSDDGILEHKCAIEAVKRLYNQKSDWSEDDMETIDRIYNFIWKNRKGDTSEIYQQEKDANWLKSLKERMKKINKKTSYTIKELKDMGFSFDLNGNILKPTKEEKMLKAYIKYLKDTWAEKACEWLKKWRNKL